MFKLEMTTGGAAFCDPYTGEENTVYEEIETTEILLKVVKQIQDGCRSGSLMDINGNKVGEWRFE